MRAAGFKEVRTIRTLGLLNRKYAVKERTAVAMSPWRLSFHAIEKL